MNYIANN